MSVKVRARHTAPAMCGWCMTGRCTGQCRGVLWTGQRYARCSCSCQGEAAGQTVDAPVSSILTATTREA